MPEPYSEKLYTYDGIVGNFDDGRLITYCDDYYRGGYYGYYIIDCDVFSKTSINPCHADCRPILINKGKNLYCIYKAKYSTDSYSFTTYQAKYSFAKGKWEDINNATADYYGEKDGYFYYWDLYTGKIAKSDLEGNISYIKGIDTINDIDVKDFNNMPSYSYRNSYAKLYITDDKSFVFYEQCRRCFQNN